MNDGVVSTDEPVPTEWPRKLYPPPQQYFHPDGKTYRPDAAKIRAQGLARYRRDPEAWKAAVRKMTRGQPRVLACLLCVVVQAEQRTPVDRDEGLHEAVESC